MAPEKPNALEQIVERLHSDFFLREFSFSRLRFSPEPTKELEFADHVVALGGTWMLFQLKAREGTDNSAEATAKWFRRKVVGDATRQIRDTSGTSKIEVRNQRDHQFNLAQVPREKTYKVVKWQRT